MNRAGFQLIQDLITLGRLDAIRRGMLKAASRKPRAFIICHNYD